MLSRDWLSHIALGGIALSALLGIALLHHHPNSPWVIKDGLTPTNRSQESKTENEQAAQDALAWLRAVKQQGKSDETANESTQKASDGQKLKDPLDLAAQWSSAMAAERLVRLSIWQICIGIAGIFAVAASLLYTRKAVELTRESLKSGADSAAAAVRAADASVKAANAAIASERAHISIEILRNNIGELAQKASFYPSFATHPIAKNNSPDGAWGIQYRFQNYGRTPGIIKEIREAVAVSSIPPENLDFSVVRADLENYVLEYLGNMPAWFCGVERQLPTYGDVADILAKKTTLWFCSEITYLDVFNQSHTHSFLFRYADIRKDRKWVLQPYNHKH